MRLPLPNGGIDFNGSVQRSVINDRIATDGHVGSYRVPDAGYLAEVQEQTITNADKPRGLDGQPRHPILCRQTAPVQVRVPNQLISENAVLKELGDEDEEGRVARRRVPD